MNNKYMKVFLSAVILCALAVMTISTVRYVNLGKQLNETDRLLSESRDAWEKTAAEKEEKQVELKALKSNLREAELSLTEAQERSVTLKEEIEVLKQEIQDLESQIAQSD